ncbi:MAG: glycosyltransferase family 2 protein [Gallionella sp.]|nr:glycosyltransferase family 2 protein [Gallionella sp.]
MRVSIITVAYNSAATIADTLRSVSGQTYPDIEHIVIDGGSTDATLEIVAREGARVRQFVSEPDAGIYDAMNKGLRLASGEVVGFLNSDDYFADPSAIEKVVRRFKERDTDAVFSCLDIVDPDNLDRVLRKYRISHFSPFMLRIGVMPPHPTFYCKKSCYDKAGPYRTDYRIAADFEMMVRLLLRYRITWSFIDETIVKMRAGGLSSSGIKSSWIVNREIIRACAENGLYTNMFILALKLPIRLWERIS